MDDEDDIVTMFKRSLEIAGFSVFGFTDPMLALEHFNCNTPRYAIVLSDVRMPQMNGIDFAENIRRSNRQVRILLMSAFDMKDLNIEPSLRVSELLQKPLSSIDLKQVVAKYVNSTHDTAS